MELPRRTCSLGCTTRPYADLPFAEMCRRIAAAGYTDVAIFGNAGIDPDSSHEQVEAIRRAAEGAGLVPSLLIARARLELGVQDAIAGYRRTIDQAATLGASWLLDLGAGSEVAADDYVALMRQAAPYAASAGVCIVLKPHGGLSLTTDDLIRACQRVNHAAFAICHDPGNIIYYTRGAERPETHVARVAPFVRAAIVKDCVVRDGQPDVMITPGEGWVDFAAFLSGLVAGGFRGPLYVECVGGTSSAEIDENVRRTRAFVQGILSDLGWG